MSIGSVPSKVRFDSALSTDSTSSELPSMADDKQRMRSEADAQLEQEIRKGRKFTLEEAIARLAGPGAMKGESPIARVQQAEMEIGTWLRDNLNDSGGVLADVLHRAVKGSDLLLANVDQPLIVLASCCQRVCDSDYLLQELVRDADIEWGRLIGERPHFNKEGAADHPDDPYTLQSVRNTLNSILERLAGRQDSDSK